MHLALMNSTSLTNTNIAYVPKRILQYDKESCLLTAYVVFYYPTSGSSNLPNDSQEQETEELLSKTSMINSEESFRETHCINLCEENQNSKASDSASSPSDSDDDIIEIREYQVPCIPIRRRAVSNILVCIKILKHRKPDLFTASYSYDTVLSRISERLLWSQCQHPNILRYFRSFSMAPDCTAIVHESFICSASYLCEEFGCLPEWFIARIVRNILFALNYMHFTLLVSMGMILIHGNLNPKLILFCQNGEVKISDFSRAAVIFPGQDPLNLLCGSSYGDSRLYFREPHPQRMDPFWDIRLLGATAIELAIGELSEARNSFDALFNNFHDGYHTKRIPSSFSWPVSMITSVTGATGSRGSQIMEKRIFISYSSEFKDFVSCCFQKNFEQRVTAADLLRHPFLLKKYKQDSHFKSYKDLFIQLYEDTDEILRRNSFDHFTQVNSWNFLKWVYLTTWNQFINRLRIQKCETICRIGGVRHNRATQSDLTEQNESEFEGVLNTMRSLCDSSPMGKIIPCQYQGFSSDVLAYAFAQRSLQDNDVNRKSRDGQPLLRRTRSFSL